MAHFHVLKSLLLNEWVLAGADFLTYNDVLTGLCLSSPSSRDELRPPAERLLPPPAAGANGRVPAHEDAQEDPGTPVVRVLRHLRQDRATHLHGEAAVLRVCGVHGVCVDLSWDTSRCL